MNCETVSGNIVRVTLALFFSLMFQESVTQTCITLIDCFMKFTINFYRINNY